MKLSDEIRVRLENGAGLGTGTWIDEVERLEAVFDAGKEQDATNQATGGRPEEWHKASPAWKLHQAIAAIEKRHD